MPSTDEGLIEPRGLSSAAAGALVFFTSGSVLVLEILAGRLMAPYVGVTLETYTGIIGVVLAGIALGTWLGGRAADAIDPRRLLGPLLTWGGALAMVSVPALLWLGPSSVGGGPESIVTLALVAFFAPAAVLSGVAPTVVKLQLADLRVTGTVVGRLSALGTTGAIVGTFVTGFFLVAAFPSRPIVLAVGAALIATGLLVWLRLGGRGDASVVSFALAVAVSGAGATVLAAPNCDVETAYYCARIDEDPARPTGRTLWLDQLRHSYVDLADPAHLEFPYSQVFRDAIDARFRDGEPVVALHIGGGGFTLPRYLRAVRPGSESVVLEVDPRLVQLARDQLGLATGPDLQVEVGDARVTLRRLPEAMFDVVLGDAFGGLAVPWHLTTSEFMQEIRRVLRPDGLYVLNLIDYEPLDFARAELATLRAAFHHVALVATRTRDGYAGGTFVMVASDVPIDTVELGERLEPHAAGRVVVSDTARIEEFVDGASVLTDERAPVDQLISQPDF